MATATNIVPPVGEKNDRNAAMIAQRRESASEIESAALDLYLSGKVKLPAIPKVAAKLVPMLSRKNADVGECVKLIEIERVLATAMLRCANSAAFFRGVATTNIRDAVMRIGLKGAAALALSLSTTALYDVRVKKALKFIGSDYESQWRRSVLVAHAARDISQTLSRGSPELAFTGGLFRNVGDSLAAFTLASLGVSDPTVADLNLEDRMKMVGRLRAVLMAEYIVRESLPDSLGDLCLEVDLPLEREAGETTLIVRLTLGLTTPADLEPTAKQEYLRRGLSAAKTMGFDKSMLDAVKEVVKDANTAVDAFAGQLKPR